MCFWLHVSGLISWCEGELPRQADCGVWNCWFCNKACKTCSLTSPFLSKISEIVRRRNSRRYPGRMFHFCWRKCCLLDSQVEHLICLDQHDTHLIKSSIQKPAWMSMGLWRLICVPCSQAAVTGVSLNSCPTPLARLRCRHGWMHECKCQDRLHLSTKT